MRYPIGESVYALAIHRQDGFMYPDFTTYIPWRDGAEYPPIEFVKLTSVVRHDVPYEYAKEGEPPSCEGFVLHDEQGRVWHNQYPVASYGQTSTIMDYRFKIHYEKGTPEHNALIDHMRSDSKEPILYGVALLTEQLNEMRHGIHCMESDDQRWHNPENAALLTKWYEHVKARFTEQFGIEISCAPLVFGKEKRVLEGRYRHKIGDI